eukprot:746788-Hanusia_phi.AAC.1
MASRRESHSGLCYVDDMRLDEHLFQPCFCFDDRTLLRELKPSRGEDVMIYGSIRGSSTEFFCFDVIQERTHASDLLAFSTDEAEASSDSFVRVGYVNSSLDSLQQSPQYFTKLSNLPESLELLQKMQFPSHVPDRRVPQAIFSQPRIEFIPKASYIQEHKQHRKPRKPHLHDRLSSQQDVKLVPPRSILSDDRLLLEEHKVRRDKERMKRWKEKTQDVHYLREGVTAAVRFTIFFLLIVPVL